MADSAPPSTTSSKRQRTVQDDAANHAIANFSAALPVVTSRLMAEKTKMEDKLLSVEFYDEDGKTLWKCDDLREGTQEILDCDDFDIPYQEPPDEAHVGWFWRRNLWKLPVEKFQGGKTDLTVCNARKIHEIRIGFHRWQCKIGQGIALDEVFDEDRQTFPRVTIPLVVENHNAKYLGGMDGDNPDLMGKDGLYLTGEYTVTSSEMIGELKRLKMENYDEDGDYYYGDFFGDYTEYLREKQKFPGKHDELRVEKVHIAISGAMKEILEFYNLHDEAMAKKNIPEFHLY